MMSGLGMVKRLIILLFGGIPVLACLADSMASCGIGHFVRLSPSINAGIVGKDYPAIALAMLAGDLLFGYVWHIDFLYG